jgi:hypothetical protein
VQAHDFAPFYDFAPQRVDIESTQDIMHNSLFLFAAGRKLNPRHADFQSAALPTELPGHIGSRIRQGRQPNVNYGLEINELP